MNSDGSFWILLDPFGSFWILWDPFGSSGFFRILWVLSDSLGFFWILGSKRIRFFPLGFFLLRFSAIDNLSRRSGTESRTRSQWLNNPYSNEFNRKATEGKRKEKKKKKKHQNNRRRTHTSLVRLPCNIRQDEQSIEIYQNKGVFSLSLSSIWFDHLFFFFFVSLSLLCFRQEFLFLSLLTGKKWFSFESFLILSFSPFVCSSSMSYPFSFCICSSW